ncbi:hypothetical protein QGM71_02740 [Virgibacillus sp. C22-A2]|uniref:Uncharacterized protein n=1 Tax=Virgibacillus tibetensis TaxID=3042313 RepID=A0ABU6KAP2_9BACI|nr:hypothetical protein [Virgibacillus sp. C22-A2]
MNFEKLKEEGKTVIYKESESEITESGWDSWGKRITENEEVFVYRKIVTFEEAEQYELENDLLN